MCIVLTNTNTIFSPPTQTGSLVSIKSEVFKDFFVCESDQLFLTVLKFKLACSNNLH